MEGSEALPICQVDLPDLVAVVFGHVQLAPVSRQRESFGTVEAGGGAHSVLASQLPAARDGGDLPVRQVDLADLVAVLIGHIQLAAAPGQRKAEGAREAGHAEGCEGSDAGESDAGESHHLADEGRCREGDACEADLASEADPTSATQEARMQLKAGEDVEISEKCVRLSLKDS